MLKRKHVIGSLATIAFFAVLLLATACRRTRTVEIAWDPPRTFPETYRVYVDEHLVREIAPPVVDAACKCLKVSVEVPGGEHRLRVDACNGTACSPGPEVVSR